MDESNFVSNNLNVISNVIKYVVKSISFMYNTQMIKGTCKWYHAYTLCPQPMLFSKIYLFFFICISDKWFLCRLAKEIKWEGNSNSTFNFFLHKPKYKIYNCIPV